MVSQVNSCDALALPPVQHVCRRSKKGRRYGS